MSYINHSGGAGGADLFWEVTGEQYGVVTNSYSFDNHTQYGRNPIILSSDELYEGWKRVVIASKGIKREVSRIEYNPYMRNLLSRNWYQVKNSTNIYAIGRFTDTRYAHVSGGTGWAVQMGIDNQREIYVFDQYDEIWFTYDYSFGKFMRLGYVPVLSKDFAGIGSRELIDSGKRAIIEVYKNTFKSD